MVTDSFRRNAFIWAYLLITSAMIFFLMDGRSFRHGEGIFTRVIPITSVVGTGIGVDYYAELARSFINGRTDFIGPFHPALASHPDPYGVDAYNEKVIIQDASYYNGKYYLYFGPLPALIYVIFYYFFGNFPTDRIVMITSLIIFNGIFIWYLGRVFVRKLCIKTLLLTIAVWHIVFFNSLVFSVLRVSTVHTISRIYAVFFAFVGLLMFWRSLTDSDQRRARNTFIASSLLGLSAFCKFNFILDLVVIVLLMLMYLFCKKMLNRRIFASLLLPVVVVGVALFYYNHIRFGSGFESGTKYQTNTLDFVHNSFFALKLDPAYNIYLIVKRTYEYFFMPFDLSPNGKLALNFGTYPFSGSPRLYSGGFLSVFSVIPLLALLSYGLLKFRQKALAASSLLQTSELKFMEIVIIVLFLLHYLQTVYLLQGFVFYTLEFLPYLAMFAILRFDVLCVLYEKHRAIFSGALLIGLLLQFSV